ncbi:MAG TPA: hypothetical protein ACFYD6_03970 [Candidatus Brocadiia bacterium]|nr:hypothetical protein [Candidatus Brocadiales bacterium]
MQKPRIILCTGIDGKVNREKINKIIETSSYSSKVKFYNVGDYMHAAAQSFGRPVAKENLVNLPMEEQACYRNTACQDIKKEIENEQPEIAIVFTRSVYPRGIARDLEVMDKSHENIRPVFCINVIDDIQTMHENIKRDRRWANISQEKLLDWRGKELEVTEDYWFKPHKIPTYLLPVQEPSETLINLLFSNRKKVYLSYPISHSLDEQKAKDKRDNFLKELRKDFIVFDPLSIKEYKKAKETNSPLIETIGDKTVSTDFKLISQCDLIVVYYPTEKIYVETTKSVYEKSQKTGILRLKSGDAICVELDEGITLSAGVINEMVHAYNNGKMVYALWFSNETPSPFFSFHCRDTGGMLYQGSNAEEKFIKDIENIKKAK